jgi:hypothetical protein
MSFGDSGFGDRVMAGDTFAASDAGLQVGESVDVALDEALRLHKAVGDDWLFILLGLRLGDELRSGLLEGINVIRLILDIVHFCSCDRCWPLKRVVLAERGFQRRGR